MLCRGRQQVTVIRLAVRLSPVAIVGAPPVGKPHRVFVTLGCWACEATGWARVPEPESLSGRE